MNQKENNQEYIEEINSHFDVMEKSISRLSDLFMKFFSWRDWNTMVYPYLKKLEEAHADLKEITKILQPKEVEGDEEGQKQTNKEG